MTYSVAFSLHLVSPPNEERDAQEFPSGMLSVVETMGSHRATVQPPRPDSCGVLWYYHIGQTGGTEALRWKLTMNFSDVLILYSDNGGQINYTDWEARELEPFLANPAGKLVAVHHHHRGPGLYGFEPTFAKIQSRLRQAGCSLTKAVVLRNPLDRTASFLAKAFDGNMSLYHWELRHNHFKTAQNGQVRFMLNNFNGEEYPFLPLGLANDDVHWQGAIEEAERILSTFEFVGFTEELDKELPRLARQLGFDESAPVMRANGHAHTSFHKLPLHIQKLMRKQNSADLKLYRKAKLIRAKQVR